MPLLKIICFTLLALFIRQAGATLDKKDLLPPEQAFKLTASAPSAERILLHWEIADGYYLYKDKIRTISKTADTALGDPVFPAGKVKHDAYFGDIEIYRGELEVPVPLKVNRDMAALEIEVKHQGCADIGVCYPPQKTLLSIDLPQPTADSSDPISKLAQGIKGLGTKLFQDELLPAEQAFQFFADVVDGETLHVSWIIAEDYYLYRGKIELALLDSEATQLGRFSIPHGEPQVDEAFGQVEIFFDEVGFDVPVIRRDTQPQSIFLQAKYQGCAARGVCYPPMQSVIELQLPAVADITRTEEKPAAVAIVSEQDRIVRSLHQETLWLTLLSFFGFGLLLAFTPCVFPMIPILSGIIVGHGKTVTTRRAFMLSLSFVLASAVTYTAFGIIAALFGSNLQTVFQQPWVILLFSAVFVLLALSMFGFYHLELPRALQTRLHNAGEKHRDGSFLGAALMGMFSSLIVGPCVAAPLAGALIYIGQTGDALLGGSALFVMGFGMGVPLLIVGASAGKLLPKAGDWLNATKAVFGVMMLAVSVWMLDRILPARITMLLWSMLLIIPAIYLNAIDPLPEHASNWRKLWKGVGLIGLVYGVLLLIGVSMGNHNPLQPLQGFRTAQAEPRQAVAFREVGSLAELQTELQRAAENGKWVILDFYADWCVSCKEMEAYTFSDPQVQRQLDNFVLLQADVTQDNSADRALLKRFDLIGPPAILFFDPQQQERPELRVIGYQDGETFSAHLRKTAL